MPAVGLRRLIMRYNLSEDEIIFYQQRKEKSQEPAKRAVEVLEDGIYTILSELGVNIDGDIKAQQAQLGIIIQEHTDENYPQLNGFYIHQVRNGDIVPVGWVGSARIDSTGKVWIDIEDFQNNTRKETGGIPIVH